MSNDELTCGPSAAWFEQAQAPEADSAAQVWARCSPEGNSLYLKLRGLPAGNLYGARLASNGELIVALGDASGTIHALQRLKPRSISANSSSTFYPAVAPLQGNYASIEGAADAPVTLICEGFATGATLREATGLPVAVVIMSSNLGPVAQALLAANPGRRLLVCGDSSRPHKSYPSPEAAQAAAKACPPGSAHWVAPEFPPHPARGFNDTCFNDLHSLCGLDEVRTQVMRAVAELLAAQNGNGPSSESADAP